jgi:hypothetical protein
MRGSLENNEIERRRNPENDVEKEGAKIFGEHDLPVAHRRGHERFDRSQFKFLGEESHRDEGENQNESEPEKDGVKEGFLDRIGDGPLIHKRDLKIEVDAADNEEKDKNDVGNWREEVAPDFTGKES